MTRTTWLTLLIIVTSCVGVFAQQADPVAYYTFDDCDGETVRDAGGHGHDGAVHGATVVDSPWGRASRITPQWR